MEFAALAEVLAEQVEFGGQQVGPGAGDDDDGRVLGYAAGLGQREVGKR
jgi:hypothetical protein